MDILLDIVFALLDHAPRDITRIVSPVGLLDLLRDAEAALARIEHSAEHVREAHRLWVPTSAGIHRVVVQSRVDAREVFVEQTAEKKVLNVRD